MSACSWIVHQKASEQEKKNHDNQASYLSHLPNFTFAELRILRNLARCE
jgi:hypothetical protein